MLTPNPLLLRTGRQRRANTAVEYQLGVEGPPGVLQFLAIKMPLHVLHHRTCCLNRLP